jgi:YHS domain-containing protein
VDLEQTETPSQANDKDFGKEEITMKSVTLVIAALWLLSSSPFGADLVNVSGASKIAVSGYDPVAFFTDARPVNGSPSITAAHEGATYFFATEEHKRLFEQNPTRYVPQYGGYCAYGVALGALFPVDINTWQVRNGKLYLNLNGEVLKKFNSDFQANVVKADRNWPGLVAKSGQ